MSFRTVGVLFCVLFLSHAAKAETVLVTGSNRGIGFEFAKQYAEKGWIVIATARRPDDAKELQELSKKFPKVSVERLDIVDGKSIADLAAKLSGQPIDVLIHNAGVLLNMQHQVIGSFDRDTFNAIMNTNAYGALAVTEAFLPNVKASQQKKVVAITSSVGAASRAHTASNMMFYRMSKAALNMAMQNLKAEPKTAGVTFGLLSPGFVETDLARELAAGTPGGRLPPAIQPQTSVAGMIKVIEGLDANTGKTVLNYDGQVIPF